VRAQDAAGDVRVILTQRAYTLRTHQGEVALPGGKRDPEDESSVATALREAQEEVRLGTSQMPPTLAPTAPFPDPFSPTLHNPAPNPNS